MTTTHKLGLATLVAASVLMSGCESMDNFATNPDLQKTHN